MSLVFCCIKNCRTVAERNADVIFHGLPQDPATFETYTAAIPEKIRKKIAKFCLICSKHFTEDCYEPAGRPKLEQNLKPGVIPTLFGGDSPVINNSNNEPQPDVNLPEEKNSEILTLEELELRNKLRTLKTDKNHLNTLIYLIENLIKYGAAFAVTEKEATWLVPERGGVRVHKRVMANTPSQYKDSKEGLKDSIDILERLNKAMKSCLPLLLGLLNTKKTIMKNNKQTYLVLKIMCLASDIAWEEDEDYEDGEDDEFRDELEGLEDEWEELGLHLDHIRGKFDDSEDDESDDYYDCDDYDEYDEDSDDQDEDVRNDNFMEFVADVEGVNGGKNIAGVEGEKKIKDDEDGKSIACVDGDKNVEYVESGENIKDRGIKDVEDVEGVKSVEDVEGVKNMKDEGVKNIGGVEGDKTVKAVDNPEVIKNVEDDDDIENIEDDEDDENVEDDEDDEDDGVDDYDFYSDFDTDSCEGTLTELESESDTDEEFDINDVFLRHTRVSGDKYSFFVSQKHCSVQLAMMWYHIVENPEVDPESSWRDLFDFESMLASTSNRATPTKRTGRNTKKTSKSIGSSRLTTESLKRRATEMKVTKGVIKQLKSDMKEVCSKDQSSS